jgi:exodeoxyribonuclease-3
VKKSELVRRGYSGVVVYSRVKPKEVENKIGLKRFDQEGRVLLLDYDQFLLLNLYLPHGGRQKENLGYKLQVYSCLFKKLKRIRKPIILAGDFNIAHQEIDLARPRENRNNIMFTR